jgi:hypothetical protein
LLIDHSLTLKAIAVKDGMNNSATLTAVYTIATPTPPDFGSESTTVTLPAVPLTNSGAAIDLSTGVTADNLAWSCTTYTPATGVTTAYTPGEVTALINNAAAKNASVTVKKAGTYIFELTASNTGSTAVTKTVTVEVGAYIHNWTESVGVDVAEINDITFPTTSLPIETTDNYAFVEANSYFSSGDFDDISYKLSADSIDENTINDAIYNGMLGKTAAFGSSTNSTIITQTFYYDDKSIGTRKFQVRIDSTQFTRIYAVNEDNTIGSRIDRVPGGELTLSKSLSETISEVE